MQSGSDSHALFLLCSNLATQSGSSPKPLSGREWSRLQRRLDAASITPSQLAPLSATEIRLRLGTASVEADRLAALFGRSGLLDSELGRLAQEGIWVVSLLDQTYPSRLRVRLKGGAPVLLYGSGKVELLNRRGLAVVGSRNADEVELALADLIGRACTASRLTVFSGSARGIDQTAMQSALDSGGTAAGLLADSLEKAVRASDNRHALEAGRLLLATEYSPRASFNVSLAMSRNKLIYALSEFGLVVTSELERGGTWAGAEEAIRTALLPVFVAYGPDSSEGNLALIRRGGIPFPAVFEEPASSLGEWLEENASSKKPAFVQDSLF